MCAGLGPSTYACIAQAFVKPSDDERENLRVKFDIAYFLAKENLPFTKYPRICELEARHGLSVGTSYRNENAGKEFIHYIAEMELKQRLGSAKFFSLLIDGSTDKGNIDNEAILVVWCEHDGLDEKVHTRMEYFTVVQPQSVTAQGLGVNEISAEHCRKLVGIGTDGASANIAAAGLKGLVEGCLSWVFWMWCLAHRLELAVKDALKATAFASIDDLLLRLYYLYEKSPKKCRELEDIITDLKECFNFDDAGVKPVRASGSRWVGHKVNAMKRVLSKFGAYTSHIATLSEDRSVKPANHAKLKGYYSKWTDAKYLVGCSLLIDLLTPCTVFSKCMQSDEVDILGALTCLLKTLKETDKLATKPLEEWPTYAATLQKFTKEDSSTLYQFQLSMAAISLSSSISFSQPCELSTTMMSFINCRSDQDSLDLMHWLTLLQYSSYFEL